MAKVTRVTQTRKAGRYNIYLDDEFAFAVDEKILLQFNLFKDAEVSDEQRAEIISAEFNQKAYMAGLVYATGSMRSRQQVLDKLREKEFPAEVRQQAVDRLIALNIINDQMFAEEYVQSQARSGKLGPNGVKYKLKQMGIDQFTIEDALEFYGEEDQLDNLEKHVETLFGKYKRESSFMANNKVQQKLYQLGFQRSYIDQALANFHDEHEIDDDEAWENLTREAEKLADRHDDLAGWDFKNKVKSGMYRKGFDLGEVERWLREYDHN
ncbi:MAG: RecX family transcriptional regulator [Lactobacillaceae bacterium]|jgi:regulatory protein|nr:RecX family transcriptional regulator [Lactobacillaceae bacterium]